MFTYSVHGKNFEVTPAIRQYAEDKISKIEKYFHDAPNTTVYVNARTYPNGEAKAEVTIPMPRLTLRAEETTQDLYGSIDLVVDKLERQVHKHKTKLNRKAREKGLPEFIKEQMDQADTADDEDNDIEIVREKTFAVKPMSPEEAVLQMEMLNHDFFLFINAKTDSAALVYQRRNGKYGLIDIEREVLDHA